jgi:GNAT superfamily N-acetyltransferase
MSGKAGATKKAAAKQVQKAKNAFEARRKASLQTVLWEAEDVPRDLLKDFVPFQRFSAGDNVTRIEFSAPGHASWTAESEAFVFDLTKRNMQPVYDTASGAGWKWNDTKKRGELFSPETRYLLARDAGSSELLGFLAFRLELEDDLEVLYVYELQVVEVARRRGLGKHMMQVAELMARKNGLQRWVVCVSGFDARYSQQPALELPLASVGFPSRRRARCAGLC